MKYNKQQFEKYYNQVLHEFEKMIPCETVVPDEIKACEMPYPERITLSRYGFKINLVRIGNYYIAKDVSYSDIEIID